MSCLGILKMRTVGMELEVISIVLLLNLSSLWPPPPDYVRSPHPIFNSLLTLHLVRPHKWAIKSLRFSSVVRSLLPWICREAAAAARAYEIHVLICKLIHEFPILYNHMHLAWLGNVGQIVPGILLLSKS